MLHGYWALVLQEGLRKQGCFGDARLPRRPLGLLSPGAWSMAVTGWLRLAAQRRLVAGSQPFPGLFPTCALPCLGVALRGLAGVPPFEVVSRA